MAVSTRTVGGILAGIAALIILLIGFCWMVLALADLSMHFYWPRYQFGYRNNDGNSPHYLFYSGFGSILLPPFITLLGAFLLFWWHSQCAVTGCFWLARRKTAAGDKTCWRHHPHPHKSFEDVCRDHHLYLGTKPGKG